MAASSLDKTRAKLDFYYSVVAKMILSRQSAVTGMIPASVAVTTHGDYRDAWVRDNVYSIYCVFGLALAYRRLDDDTGRAYELEQSTVKCMRGLLASMMRQAAKVEKFKHTQNPMDSLHAKYNTQTGDTVVADWEWGHLQIDATSIFLLALAEMTTAGLSIAFNQDEVDFVQNLAFYIERAYRTPDYGIWERGNKLNHGQPELNSSSIGMALAALQAINGINLYGARGGPGSVVHVYPDEINRNFTTLLSALPRESNSKEVDAALLSVIGWPAFAVPDKKLVDLTRKEIRDKLQGRYGCKRFLRDGHQTVLEDHTRLHYEANELQKFEHVESEWPLFFTYFLIDSLFRSDQAATDEYADLLRDLLVSSGETGHQKQTPNGVETHHEVMGLVPELYIVPKESIDSEKRKPGSQKRVAGENVPLVWAQSLYIISLLLMDRLLHPSDIDPLGRRLIPDFPPPPPTVQVVLLAESAQLQTLLSTYGLHTQTMQEVEPVTVSPPGALRDALGGLGRNAKLGLTGRVGRPMGALSTSRLYRCQGRLYCFLPHFLDREEFYMVSDESYLLTVFESTLGFLRNYWTGVGRPTMVVLLTETMFNQTMSVVQSRDGSRVKDGKGAGTRRTLLDLAMQLKEGMANGVKVRLGRLQEMIPTSQIESLDFLISKSLPNEDFHATLSAGNILAKRRAPERLSVSARATEGGRRVRKRSTFVRVGEMGTGFASTPGAAVTPITPFGLPMATPISSTLMGTASRGTPYSSPTFRTSYFDGASTFDEPSEETLPDSQHPDHVRPSLSSETSDRKWRLKALATPSERSRVAWDQSTLRDLPNAIRALSSTSDLHEQADLLQYVFTLKGKDYRMDSFQATVEQLIEEVYQKARDRRFWDVVRQAAGVSQKMVNSLTSNLTDLLVRKIPVTLGFGASEFLISSSMNLNPDTLKEAIFSHVSDVRDGPLIEELITYLGGFVRANPEWFYGIFRLRTHFLVMALRDELSRSYGCSEEDAHRRLMESSPFEILTLVRQVLTAHQETESETAPGNSALLPPIPTRAVRGIPQPMNATATPLIRTMSPAIPLNIARAGRRGLPSIFALTVQLSNGVGGSFIAVTLTVDGRPEILPDHINALLTPTTRGIIVVTFDPVSGTADDGLLFDTHESPDESAELAKHLEELEHGQIVMVAAKDEVCRHLSPAALQSLGKLGSRAVTQLHTRDAWAVIVESGSPETCVEAYTPASENKVVSVEKTFDLAARRRKVNFLEMAEREEIVKSTVMAMVGPSQGRWYRRRRLDGALNRVPEKFYPKVWMILRRCRGLSLTKDKILFRDPLTSEKTPEEFNFALVVETFLDSILNIGERTTATEVLNVLHKALEEHRDLNLSGEVLDLLEIIKDATKQYWKTWLSDYGASLQQAGSPSPSYDLHSRLARRLFFDLEEQQIRGLLAESVRKVVFRQR